MQENVNIPDSNITTNLTFRQLVLMNMQQLTNFPYIEKDFDALTDYELLCLVVKFLNDVIANQNEQNASITRMYESFLALQDYVNNTKDELETAFNNLDNYVRNYFDNLDVQEEINNKLDKMLEDGVLEQIIEQFLKSTALWCFDTVAEMKQATNLIDGSYARTLGYYTINDGGDGLYKIVDDETLVDDGGSIHVLSNGLRANLIINTVANVKQFGAKGDGETDDTQHIINAVNSGVEELNFNSDETYYTTNDIDINNQITLNGNNCTIKRLPVENKHESIFNVNSACNIYNFNFESTKTYNAWHYVLTLTDMMSSNIFGLYINSDNVNVKNIKATNLFSLIYFKVNLNVGTIKHNINLEDLIDDSCSFGMFLSHTSNVYINNCKIVLDNKNSLCHALYIERNCSNIRAINSTFSGGGYTVNPHPSDDTIGNYSNSGIQHVFIDNCIIENGQDALGVWFTNDITFNNCKISCDRFLLHIIYNASDIIIKNCEIYCEQGVYYQSLNNEDTNNVIIKNNTIYTNKDKLINFSESVTNALFKLSLEENYVEMTTANDGLLMYPKDVTLIGNTFIWKDTGIAFFIKNNKSTISNINVKSKNNIYQSAGQLRFSIGDIALLNVSCISDVFIAEVTTNALISGVTNQNDVINFKDVKAYGYNKFVNPTDGSITPTVDTSII